MSGALVLLVVPVVAVAALVLVGALVVAGGLGAERTGLHRGALLARWAGLLLGLLMMGVVVSVGTSGGSVSGPLAHGALASFGPAAGGLVLVLAIAGGELTLPAPRNSVRRASLRRRTAGDLVPRFAVVLCTVAVGVLVLLTAISTVLATDGRFYVTGDVLEGGGILESTSSPFPGAQYTLPIWGGLLVLCVAAALALRVILRRRPSDDVQDILLRRRSFTSVLGALVLVASLILLPVAALMGMQLLPSAEHAATGVELACIVLSGVGVVVGLLVLPVGLVMVVFPEAIARKGAPRDVGVPETVVDGSDVAGVQGERR